MPEYMHDGLADGLHDGIAHFSKLVVNPEPLPSRLHETSASKIREMPRRFRLTDSKTLVDMTDADLTAQQQPEDP